MLIHTKLIFFSHFSCKSRNKLAVFNKGGLGSDFPLNVLADSSGEEAKIRESVRPNLP